MKVGSNEVSVDIDQIRDNVRNSGWHLQKEAYSQDFCEKVICQIDSVETTIGVETSYSDSEIRIWSAEKRFDEVAEFAKDADKLVSSIQDKHENASSILAIVNRPLSRDLEANSSGRWHIDSWRSQLKVFLFLSATTEDSGPLEIIPGSNALVFRFRKAFEPGFFFDWWRLLKGEDYRAYESIADQKIALLSEQGLSPFPLLVPAGSLLIADTSYLIHRARPCLEKSRYALTAYYSSDPSYKNFDVD